MNNKLLDYVAYAALFSIGVGLLGTGIWLISWLTFWPALFLSMVWIGALMVFALTVADKA
jgi:hypothetical protein